MNLTVKKATLRPGSWCGASRPEGPDTDVQNHTDAAWMRVQNTISKIQDSKRYCHMP